MKSMEMLTDVPTYGPTHSGSNWLKPAKNKFTQSDFTSFSMQIPAYSNSFRFRVLPASCQKFVKLLQEQVQLNDYETAPYFI